MYLTRNGSHLNSILACHVYVETIEIVHIIRTFLIVMLLHFISGKYCFTNFKFALEFQPIGKFISLALKLLLCISFYYMAEINGAR